METWTPSRSIWRIFFGDFLEILSISGSALKSVWRIVGHWRQPRSHRRSQAKTWLPVSQARQRTKPRHDRNESPSQQSPAMNNNIKPRGELNIQRSQLETRWKQQNGGCAIAISHHVIYDGHHVFPGLCPRSFHMLIVDRYVHFYPLIYANWLILMLTMKKKKKKRRRRRRRRRRWIFQQLLGHRQRIFTNLQFRHQLVADCHRLLSHRSSRWSDQGSLRISGILGIGILKGSCSVQLSISRRWWMVKTGRLAKNSSKNPDESWRILKNPEESWRILVKISEGSCHIQLSINSRWFTAGNGSIIE